MQITLVCSYPDFILPSLAYFAMMHDKYAGVVHIRCESKYFILKNDI